MRNNVVLCLIQCMVWLVFSCTNSPMGYNRVLDRAEKQNAAYDSITNLDSIEMATKYYDRHGSSMDQVRAHYLLGCAYRDAGEAPKALECFHEADSHADTMQADFDYMMLVKIHSQIAELLYHQLLPYDQLKELEAMRHYALKAGNTLCAINAIEHKAGAYELLELSDSAISLRQQAYNEYKSHGYLKEAATSLGPLIMHMIKRGDSDRAKRYIDTYEKESGFVTKGEIIGRKTVFYYFKGCYYLSVNQTDSAQILFRKLLSDTSPDQVEAGYRGLYLLYKKTGQRDSLAKYADLCYQQNNSNIASTAHQDIQKMQSLYNYSRSQKEALVMKDKANRAQTRFVIVLIVAIIAICAGMIAWLYVQHKRREEIGQMKIRYENEKQSMEKTKSDILKLKDEAYSQLKAEKDQELAEHEKRIKEYEGFLHIKSEKTTIEELQSTPVYKRIRYVLKSPKARMNKTDWNDLVKMIDEKIPTFYQTLKGKYPKLNEADYHLCILVRLEFTPSEMSFLTGIPISSISMKRSRLLYSIFKCEGKPEMFDKKIREIL